MTLMSEIVGQKGVYSFLNRTYEMQDILSYSIINIMIKETNMSQNAFSDLINSGIFFSVSDGFCISLLGKRVTILLRGINGEIDAYELFNKLSSLESNFRPYELITEDITGYFIDNLYNQPNFIRLYICSPWIRLDQEHIEKINDAIFIASKQYKNLQIRVITLPIERYRDKKGIETIKYLKQLGAEILVNSKLHTKLYMSEPGPFGGSYYAILGSENLTGRRNIELAIKIENDNEILRKLSEYFNEIMQESQLLKEV